MAMQKYGSPEKGEVLAEEEHKGIWARLKKVGKKSVGEMTDEEKEDLMRRGARKEKEQAD